MALSFYFNSSLLVIILPVVPFLLGWLVVVLYEWRVKHALGRRKLIIFSIGILIIAVSFVGLYIALYIFSQTPSEKKGAAAFKSCQSVSVGMAAEQAMQIMGTEYYKTSDATSSIDRYIYATPASFSNMIQINIKDDKVIGISCGDD